MQFEFDSNKNRSNLAKHGVPLSLAAELDWESALIWADDRFAYREHRGVALAPLGRTLMFVAFVDRNAVRRVISLRRANRREVRRYAQVFEEDADQDADPH